MAFSSFGTLRPRFKFPSQKSLVIRPSFFISTPKWLLLRLNGDFVSGNFNSDGKEASKTFWFAILNLMRRCMVICSNPVSADRLNFGHLQQNHLQQPFAAKIGHLQRPLRKFFTLFYLHLRSKKVESLRNTLAIGLRNSFTRSHSIMTRGSVTLPCATIPHLSCFSKS